MKNQIAKFLFTALLASAFSYAAALPGSTLSGKVTAGKGVSVVYVEAVAGKTFPPPAENVIIDQKGLLFQPHVAAVPVGATVEFLNSDKVAHNIFWPAISGNKKLTHNLGTWPKGEKKSFQFNDLGVASLLCNVHPEMSGYVVVVATPYFAVTDNDGNYEIKNVPAGKYTLKTWSEDGKPTTQSVDVSGSGATADLTVKK
jgi:plastocyanin